MAHTFDNISFEDPDGASAVDVDGNEFEPNAWTATVVSSAEEYVDFGTAGFVERAERFEAHWSGLATFVHAYADPLDLAELGIATFNTLSGATTFESFEREWEDNENFHHGLSLTASASFDTTAPQNFENFEEEWSDNENFASSIADITTATAAFDTAPENFEDFEEGWDDNDNYAFAIGDITTETAIFSGAVVDPYENFEHDSFIQWQVFVANAVNNGRYTITIEGEPHTYIADAATSATEIRDGLLAAIAAGSQPVVAVAASAADIFISRDETVLVPARNTPLALIVEGPEQGDLLKIPPGKTENWTQTGQMTFDP